MPSSFKKVVAPRRALPRISHIIALCDTQSFVSANLGPRAGLRWTPGGQPGNRQSHGWRGRIAAFPVTQMSTPLPTLFAAPSLSALNTA